MKARHSFLPFLLLLAPAGLIAKNFELSASRQDNPVYQGPWSSPTVRDRFASGHIAVESKAVVKAVWSPSGRHYHFSFLGADADRMQNGDTEGQNRMNPKRNGFGGLYGNVGSDPVFISDELLLFRNAEGVISSKTVRNVDAVVAPAYTGYGTLAAVSPDKQTLLLAAEGDSQNTAQLISWATGNVLTVFGAGESAHTSRCHTAAFSPDGATVVTGGMDGAVKFWNASTGALLRTIDGNAGRDVDLNGPEQVWDIKYSPDGKYVAAAMNDGARIWNAENGELVHLLTGHSQGLTSLSYAPDGKLLVTGSYDNTARIWDTAAGQSVNVLKHDDIVSTVAWHPSSGYCIISGDQSGRAYQWMPG